MLEGYCEKHQNTVYTNTKMIHLVMATNWSHLIKTNRAVCFTKPVLVENVKNDKMVWSRYNANIIQLGP